MSDDWKALRDEIFAGFEPPVQAPQGVSFEDGSATFNTVKEIFERAPVWTEEMAGELFILCQRHQVVASAIMFSMQVAAPAAAALRHTNTIEETKFHQGQIAGLERYLMALHTQMEAVLEPKGDEDEIPVSQ